MVLKHSPCTKAYDTVSIGEGCCIQVFGPESSGKTTLAMNAIAAVQAKGGTAALIDAEHAFDPVYSKVRPEATL
jgi:recombination protein RecA